MFENSGEKIKKLAKVLFVLNVIVFVILAFVFGWERGRYGTWFNPVWFFTFIIGGPLVSYIECLIMYAFGELVDSTENVNRNLKPIVNKINSNTENLTSDKPAPIINRLNTNTSKAAFDKSESKEKKSFIICPSCGEENSGGQMFCFKCGTRL